MYMAEDMLPLAAAQHRRAGHFAAVEQPAADVRDELIPRAGRIGGGGVLRLPTPLAGETVTGRAGASTSPATSNMS